MLPLWLSLALKALIWALPMISKSVGPAIAELIKQIIDWISAHPPHLQGEAVDKLQKHFEGFTCAAASDLKRE